jgi:hypothetical protein
MGGFTQDHGELCGATARWTGRAGSSRASCGLAAAGHHTQLVKLHEEQLTVEKRLESAEQTLVQFMADDIRPEFEQLL